MDDKKEEGELGQLTPDEQDGRDSDAPGKVKIQSTPKPQTPVKQNKALNINDKLKETLEKHGIAKQNATSFLKGLLMDKDFKDLVKANLDEEDENSDTESTEVRMTRSKLKEVMQNSPFKAPWPISPCKGPVEKVLPKFTDINLSENEDEDDEEYRPLESSFDSDTLEHPHNDDEKSKDQDVKNVLIFTSAEENNPEIVQDLNLQTDELAGPSVIKDTDLISRRTRSKHSLEFTSLNVLEAAFQPPDATADMYDTQLGDYDWQKWLADLMDDTGGGKTKEVAEDEDDPVADPDFNFTPELDKPDQEDFRNDQSVRISKKELYCLLDEIEEMEDDDWAPITYPQMNDSLASSTDQGESRTSGIMRSPKRLSDIPELPLLNLVGSQVVALQQQIQQHVQLLSQTNVLSRNREDLIVYVEDSKQMLLELRDIGQSQMKQLGIKSSAVHSCNLNEAIELTEKKILSSEACIRLNRMEKIKGHVPIQKAVAEVIANSSVFMYKELLPLSAPAQPNFQYKPMFSLAEDNLIALGMAEMSSFTNYQDLIREHLLPGKTTKQIQSRMRNILYCRTYKDSVNPIRKYHSCNIIPKPCTHIKYVYPETSLQPIHMKDMLPNWLLALQPIYIQEESGSSIGTPQKVRQTQTSISSSILTPTKGAMIPYIPITQTVPSDTQIKPNSTINTQTHNTFTVVQAVPIQKPKGPVKILPKPQSSTTATVSVTACTSSVGLNQSSTTKTVDATKTSLPSSVPVSLTTSDEDTAAGSSNEKLEMIQDSTEPMETDEITDLEKHENIDKETENDEDFSHKPSHYYLPSSSSENEDEELDKTFNDKLSGDEEGMQDLTLKQDDGSKSQPESEDDCASDTFSSPTRGHSSKKSTEEDERNKSVKIKFSKIENGFRAQPLGGYLQKIHPKLSGRKSKSSSKDSKTLFNAAKTIRNLEEDTIVQLDPTRMEKENIFAMGYHDRVKETLADHPEVYEKFLETLIKYGDGTRSPVELYSELSALLRDWPVLIQAFAPFLMPEQAQECGLNAEQELYGRARKFLRQLEITFSDNSDHMEKILNVFHTVAGTAIYREEEMMKSILNLLRDYPYLQDEFLTFFDDQYPPGIHLDDDFEEVELSEDLMRDPTINQFEQITIPSSSQATDSPDVPEIVLKRGKKRRLSLTARERSKSPAKLSPSTENKENVFPEVASLDADDEGEEMFNTDYESEEEIQELDDPISDKIIDEKSSSSLPPDISIISEDAISASPFKRITDKTEEEDSLLRPDTPNGIRSESIPSINYNHSLPSPTKSASRDMNILPSTPTGKVTNEKKVIPSKETQDLKPCNWTREMDEQILANCKTNGATQDTFKQVAENIGRSNIEVEGRFQQLLALLTGTDTDDTMSQESDDEFETESDVSRDSSVAYSMDMS